MQEDPQLKHTFLLVSHYINHESRGSTCQGYCARSFCLYSYGRFYRQIGKYLQSASASLRQHIASYLTKPNKEKTPYFEQTTLFCFRTLGVWQTPEFFVHLSDLSFCNLTVNKKSFSIAPSLYAPPRSSSLIFSCSSTSASDNLITLTAFWKLCSCSLIFQSPLSCSLLRFPKQPFSFLFYNMFVLLFDVLWLMAISTKAHKSHHRCWRVGQKCPTGTCLSRLENEKPFFSPNIMIVV